jgi:predicted SAM-dependent methyltransferase
MPKARHVAERAVAPYLRTDLAATLDELRQVEARTEQMYTQIGELQRRHDELAAATARLERHQPTVLNAISTANGASRLLRRELVEAHRQIAELADLCRAIGASASEIAPEILAVMRPHIDTIGWLLRRVETLRAEMLYEMRYGRGQSSVSSAGNADTDQTMLSSAEGPIRLNLGCGHLPIDGYVNVDMRPLPGVDVVAGVDQLPADEGSVAEIFSAHLLEHFPEEQLRRQLLPYWWSLLQPGGTFRAVVPDSEAMLAAYSAGKIGFTELRRVIFGDQEYEGDFHFNAFTTQSLTELLEKTGFVDVRVVEAGRLNGDCLEAEIEATRPPHRDA